MRGLLLDSNVVSELRKPESRRDAGVTTWAEQVDFRNTYLSVITITEIKRGILSVKRRDQKQAHILDTWLKESILETYHGRILTISTETALKAAALQVPDKHQLADAYLAATALEHKLTFVTRNVADFLDTGVHAVNPWEPGVTQIKMT